MLYSQLYLLYYEVDYNQSRFDSLVFFLPPLLVGQDMVEPEQLALGEHIVHGFTDETENQ